MSHRRATLLLLLALTALLIDHAAGFDISFWAWQRDEPLTAQELTQLADLGVKNIYWHVGELENTGDTWRWKVRFHLPDDTAALHFIPVVRMVSRDREPFTSTATAALTGALERASNRRGEIQLDYDAPDRLLPDYGRTLGEIHKIVGHLTITALPHWSRAACLQSLRDNVDEFFPMLYDFEAEPVLQNNAPQPLIMPDKMARMLQEWSACEKPWHAGLPTFARLTVYDANGKSRGQIRNWNWDEICLNDNLTNISEPAQGVSLLRAQKPLSISNTKLQAGDQLVVRLTDRASLRDAIEEARHTSATGVTLFRLPDSSASSGWSIIQLAHLEEKPKLVLHRTSTEEALILENTGRADLAPALAFSADKTHGYAVEIEADLPIFREAESGDFAAVNGYDGGRAGFKPVAVPFAARLAFSFSQLRAGETLKTGLIQLAPGASFRQARWRVSNVVEHWKLLE